MTRTHLINTTLPDMPRMKPAIAGIPKDGSSSLGRIYAGFTRPRETSKVYMR